LTTKEYYNDVFKEILYIFINNGYHSAYINKVKDNVINNINKPKPTNPKQIYWRLPYKQKMENENKKVVRTLNNYLSDKAQIRIAYNVTKTQNFFSNKDKVPDSVKSHLVYQYTCDQCSGAIYTGETIRHLETRCNEHLTGRPVPTEVTQHGHPLKRENFKIICQTRLTKIGEALTYNNTTANKRINKYRPPFVLKIFNFQSNFSLTLDS
jgi:hypothetical protein